MAHKFAFDICLTNLGNLRYETNFDQLRLAAIWGLASGSSGFEGEQAFGAATADGVLCLLHISHQPMESLLEVTGLILVSACELAGGNQMLGTADADMDCGRHLSQMP